MPFRFLQPYFHHGIVSGPCGAVGDHLSSAPIGCDGQLGSGMAPQEEVIQPEGSKYTSSTYFWDQTYVNRTCFGLFGASGQGACLQGFSDL